MKNDLYYIYWLIRTYPMRWNFPRYKILSFEETVNEIIQNKKSISRFGDGEFRLLMKERSIYFQPLTASLAERLQEVIVSKLPNLLIAIPGTFRSRKNIKRDPKIHWLQFVNLYSMKLSAFLSMDVRYAEALISRFYMDYKNKNHVKDKVHQLKKIWNDQNILFVEGEFSRLGIGNDLFGNANSLERIICPAQNAYSKYDEILSLTKKIGKDRLIIIALGPTATILAHDLAKENYWALDLGHIDIEYIWYLMKADKKVTVGGKKSAEVNEEHHFTLSESEKKEYLNSIISKII